MILDRADVYEEKYELINSLEGNGIMRYRQFKRSGKCVKKGQGEVIPVMF